MRITTMNQLAATLHLAPSSLADLRRLDLEDVARLATLIEQADSRHRDRMRRAIDEALPLVPAGLVRRLLRRSGA